MPRLLVVKYGGSVLDSGTAIRRAAEAVREELGRGSRMVIVVSAMKGVTDQLLSAAGEISLDTPREVVDHIIGLGEEQSVRLMASALKSLGVDAVEVTPHTPSWPIVTDGNYGDAEPILEECESRAELGVKPLIERGQVPIVCGFVGRSLDGNITTLGRGGGDTTATLLARCLGADELVLVKDVGGVYSADPRKVEGARPLEEMSAWEANLLASSGAKILHSKVFRYKPDGLRIRLVSYEQSLNGSGTLVSGTIPELEVEIHGERVAKLTVVGEIASDPEALAGISRLIVESGGRVMSLKGMRDSSTVFVTGALDDVLNDVHPLVVSMESIKAISGTDGLALVRIRGRALDDIAAGVYSIGKALSSTGVVMWDLVVGESSVDAFVDWEKRFEAKEVIEESFRRRGVE
ncbi:aspartate kinase [Candidatus Bathyarchaeota archaeon]|nr:aspartate kinase [Candidatus Bathyarchaeota archaeon]